MQHMWACAVVGLVAMCTTASRAQPSSPAPNNLVYEIFVRAFADGDLDASGIGDLRGITARFDDYLNDGNPATDSDLEVGVLWLMPVFPSPSYHGYDVTDYRSINPDYGTLADFRQLVAAAHARGVRVILDVPFNHTSDRHPWFREAIDNPSSPRRQFYSIEPDTEPHRSGWHVVTNPSGERLRYLGIFSPQMPDLNLDNPEVRKEVEAIATSGWISASMDSVSTPPNICMATVSSQLTEDDILRNNEWWREFSHVVYRRFPNAILLAKCSAIRRCSVGTRGASTALLDEPFMNDIRAQLLRPGRDSWAADAIFLEETRALNRTAYDPSLPFPDQPFEPYTFIASHDRNPRLASDSREMKAPRHALSVDEVVSSGDVHAVVGVDPSRALRGRRGHAAWMEMERQPAERSRNPGDGSGIYDETLREPFPWFASGRGEARPGGSLAVTTRPMTASRARSRRSAAACSTWCAG